MFADNGMPIWNARKRETPRLAISWNVEPGMLGFGPSTYEALRWCDTYRASVQNWRRSDPRCCRGHWRIIPCVWCRWSRINLGRRKDSIDYSCRTAFSLTVGEGHPFIS